MRIHNFHTKRSLASLGDGMNPRGNTVGVQMLLEGSGAVAATRENSSSKSYNGYAS